MNMCQVSRNLPVSKNLTLNFPSSRLRWRPCPWETNQELTDWVWTDVTRMIFLKIPSSLSCVAYHHHLEILRKDWEEDVAITLSTCIQFSDSVFECESQFWECVTNFCLYNDKNIYDPFFKIIKTLYSIKKLYAKLHFCLSLVLFK